MFACELVVLVVSGRGVVWWDAASEAGGRRIVSNGLSSFSLTGCSFRMVVIVLSGFCACWWGVGAGVLGVGLGEFVPVGWSGSWGFWHFVASELFGPVAFLDVGVACVAGVLVVPVVVGAFGILGAVFDWFGEVPVFAVEIDAGWGFHGGVEGCVDCDLEDGFEVVWGFAVFPEDVEGLLCAPVCGAEFFECGCDEVCLAFGEHGGSFFPLVGGRWFFDEDFCRRSFWVSRLSSERFDDFLSWFFKT